MRPVTRKRGASVKGLAGVGDGRIVPSLVLLQVSAAAFFGLARRAVPSGRMTASGTDLHVHGACRRAVRLHVGVLTAVVVAIGGDRRADGRAHRAADDGPFAIAQLVTDHGAEGASGTAADGGFELVAGPCRHGRHGGENQKSNGSAHDRSLFFKQPEKFRGLGAVDS